MVVGVREGVEEDQNKRNQADFVLWFTTSKFENHEFMIFRDYDQYLTKNYGDYMQLPPVEERQPHHGVLEIVL